MRNKFKMFISFTLVIAMLTSCRSSSFDNSKHSSNMDGSLETSNDTLDISESNYSSTEDESEDNYDDYSSDELIEGKTQSFTVGDKSLPDIFFYGHDHQRLFLHSFRHTAVYTIPLCHLPR